MVFQCLSHESVCECTVCFIGRTGDCRVKVYLILFLRFLNNKLRGFLSKLCVVSGKL